MALSSSTKLIKPGGFREFFRIAYPLVISNAATTLMHFIDRLFLSWSSPEEFAACIPASVLAWTILSILVGISEYSNSFVAQFYGAKRYASIGATIWQGIWFSLFGGIVCLAFLPAGLMIFDHVGHPSDVILHEKRYFSIILSGGVFFILKESLSSFYSGRGKTKVIMAVNIIANLINAVLDYALIFGVGFIPAMGIRGAALATLISIISACLIFFALFASISNSRLYDTRRIRFDFPLMKRMIRFGAPSGVQFFLDISSFTVFVFIIGRLGKIELAVSNIALSISSLAWLPMLGAAMATATLVGQYIGRNDYETAEKSTYTALIAVEFYMILFGLIYIFLPDLLLSLFQGENTNTDIPFEDIQEYGRLILLLVALYQIGDAMNITFSGALRGAGDTSFAMRANIICSWILFAPGTWLTVVFFQQGLIGAWCWATAYIILLGGVFFLRFRSGYWKTIRMIPADSEETQ
ncbi:MAG: MATE family efflux transporter [Candidatus Omnitrophica bacterium]|nr:MATE family efflux transporter [Candidatus Omnitrophota bacterium]